MRKDRTPTVAVVKVPYWPDAWTGWHFTAAGKQLVSPDGDRIAPERLRGLLWRATQESRVAAARAREERVCRVVRELGRSVDRERKPDGR